MARSSSHFYSFSSQPTAQAVSVSASASGIPGFSISTAMSAMPVTSGSLPVDVSSAQTLQDIQLLSDLFSV